MPWQLGNPRERDVLGYEQALRKAEGRSEQWLFKVSRLDRLDEKHLRVLATPWGPRNSMEDPVGIQAKIV